MKHYEYITDQTIQLFPQLFLGKHGALRASQRFVKPSDNVGASHSSHVARRLGVGHMVNSREHAKCRKGKRSRRECGSNAWSYLAQVSVGVVTAQPPSSGSIRLLAYCMNLQCLDKRHSVMSKVTSSRPLRAVYPAGRLTGNGMLIAAGVRDGEEANASGNAEDRAVPPPPFQGAGTHPSWRNAC